MKKACIPSTFRREPFPNQTWTSIAALYNPSMPLHRDMLNVLEHANHAITLGISWKVESGSKMKTDGQATALLKTKAVRSYNVERGLTCMDKTVSFNAWKYDMLEKHRGNMWALCRMYASSIQTCS